MKAKPTVELSPVQLSLVCAMAGGGKVTQCGQEFSMRSRWRAPGKKFSRITVKFGDLAYLSSLQMVDKKVPARGKPYYVISDKGRLYVTLYEALKSGVNNSNSIKEVF